ncbi:MAG: hypothetical protein EBR40_03085 [Proteobacteria bacterium]|nr:hypothetical protein [Pseudomonadota bacterium]
MNFIQFITLVLMSLEPSYGDKEPWDVREKRMEIVAKAIDDASSKATCSDAYAKDGCKPAWTRSKKDLALLLVTKGYWESRFAKNVHEGKCRPYECDAHKINGNVVHRARSPWQVQRTGLETADEYSKMRSSTLESTAMSAEVASRHLVMGMNRCRTIKGAISVYGGVGTCNWSGAEGRLAFFNRINSQNEAGFKKAADNQRKKLEDRLNRETSKK